MTPKLVDSCNGHAEVGSPSGQRRAFDQPAKGARPLAHVFRIPPLTGLPPTQDHKTSGEGWREHPALEALAGLG
jgi:hypothetical protein